MLCAYMLVEVTLVTELLTTDTTLEILHLQMHGAEMSVQCPIITESLLARVTLVLRLRLVDASSCVVLHEISLL